MPCAPRPVRVCPARTARALGPRGAALDPVRPLPAQEGRLLSPSRRPVPTCPRGRPRVTDPSGRGDGTGCRNISGCQRVGCPAEGVGRLCSGLQRAALAGPRVLRVARALTGPVRPGAPPRGCSWGAGVASDCVSRSFVEPEAAGAQPEAPSRLRDGAAGPRAPELRALQVSVERVRVPARKECSRRGCSSPGPELGRNERDEWGGDGPLPVLAQVCRSSLCP